MIIPTKITPSHKSLIYKALLLLNNENKDFSYSGNSSHFSSITEYIDTMTILFSLGYLDEPTVEVNKNDSIRE
ncbi:hypothetical protein IGI42_000740 [Enterococcus sp. AZ109]